MRSLVRLAVITAILSIALIGAACAKTVQDKSGTFTVGIPSDWTVESSEDLICVSGPVGIPRITVNADDANGMELDVFAEAFIKGLSKNLKEFNLISSIDTRVGGEDAKLWVYTSKVGDNTYKFRTYAFLHGTKMYSVIFVTLEDCYDDDAVECCSLIVSWTWI